MQILRKLAPLAPLLLAPLSPLGVPKYFQDPKTSLGTSRDGLKPIQAFIWYKVINFTLPSTVINHCALF